MTHVEISLKPNDHDPLVLIVDDDSAWLIGSFRYWDIASWLWWWLTPWQHKAWATLTGSDGLKYRARAVLVANRHARIRNVFRTGRAQRVL